jgi:processive 1,2-diacylglycerol beta-glucosyltransferase
MTEAKRKLKVVIFTASYGGGHNAVSSALVDAFKTFHPDEAEVEVIDYMKKFAAGRDSVLRALYVKSTLYWPWTYAVFFYLSDKLFANSIGRKFGLIGGKGVQEYIESEKPDIIISVYPTPGQVLPDLELKHRPLLSTLVTDFGAHAQWINPRTDLFLVTSQNVKDFLMSTRGIKDGNVKITGIPIRLVYSRPVDVAALRKKFNLKYDFSLLMMANGQTWHDIKSICTKLLELPIHIIALCGKDEELINKVKELGKNTDKIITFGIAKDIDELMRVGDVLISKAGGITVSEALACSLPIIMYRPYPGQEIYNRDYLLEHKAGFLANKPQDVYEQVKSICLNKDRLKEIKENAKRLSHADAAQQVSNILIEEHRKRFQS